MANIRVPLLGEPFYEVRNKMSAIIIRKSRFIRKSQVGSLLLVSLLLWAACSSPEFDTIIAGGTVVDGSGKDRFNADIGIREGRIVEIGDLTNRTAVERVDATGMTVTPGFIDIHSHATSESWAGSDISQRRDTESYVRQGVATAMGGQDGSSPLDIGAFLDSLDVQPAAINIGLFIGHGSIRSAVIGEDNVQATTEQLAEMTQLVEQAMREGAFGLSSGLEYTPAAFAEISEVVEMARPVATYDGLYISHIRDEGGRLLESVDEVLEIGRSAGARVQVTHHKLIGKSRWGGASQSLALLDEAMASGVDVSSDQYPYTASSTGLTILFPNWSKDGGFEALVGRINDPTTRAQIRKDVIDHINAERGADPSTIVAARCGFDASFNGKSLADILIDRKLPVTVENAADVALELVAAGSCSGVFHSMSPDDVITIMQHAMTSISSDGGIPAMNEGVPHPRNYGAFARVLAYYVRELRVLTLEQAVYKMTALPASRLGLTDRGKIAVGMVADLAILNPDEVQDQALFGDPHHYATGVRDVFVGGVPIMRGAEMLGSYPGIALRHPSNLNK